MLLRGILGVETIAHMLPIQYHKLILLGGGWVGFSWQSPYCQLPMSWVCGTSEHRPWIKQVRFVGSFCDSFCIT